MISAVVTVISPQLCVFNMKFIGSRDIAVTVESLEKSRIFYEKVLGFTPNNVKEKLVVYDTGAISLYVQELELHPPVPSFTVENLAEARTHLEANGCVVTKEWKRSLYFRDPDGNVWDIIEP